MSTAEAWFEAIIYIIVAMVLMAIILYGLTFIAAWIRDLVGRTPNTPDLSSLNPNHPNVSLWLRRIKDDPNDAAHHMFRIGRGTLWVVIGLVVLALVIWGVVSMWGALSGAPAWALIMFFVLLVVLLGRR